VENATIHFENLGKLQEQIEDISLPLEAFTKRLSEDEVQYTQLNGTVSTAVRIAKNCGMAFCEWNAEAGSEFIQHKHEEADEWGFIFSGAARFWLEGEEERIVKAPVMVPIPKNRLHWFIVTEDIRAFFISIPAIEEYP
jgi:quercetin dioxygenase-like cupin family protein